MIMFTGPIDLKAQAKLNRQAGGTVGVNGNRTSVLKYLNFQLSNMELLKDVNTSFWTSDLRHRKYLGRVFIGTPILDV
ncbi:8874_t:CDS:2 [Rhizophagus irregularis]|nr:8874_t:CDS:2 [Rhizophagus irregularis]